MKSKTVLLTLLTALLFFFSASASLAVYDPASKPNNIFGIHILFPEEISEAARLVNSSGGDWGYITIPIQASDKNLKKWQNFMDSCREKHLIPLVRLATDGDYFNTVSWSKPTEADVLDFANFLNSLNWPTKNRYVIIYNEVNRGDEWGGSPQPAEYANILSYASDAFKQRSDEFFVISAGLDNASADIAGQSMNEYNFLRQMDAAVPAVFEKIDGISSHSYPNPGFSQPPLSYGYQGTASFKQERDLIENLSGKSLPVFITETGWTGDKISDSVQSAYYQTAFTSVWNDQSVIAVTPFILSAGGGPFTQFSFIKEGSEKEGKYNTVINMAKVKGEPILNNYPLASKPVGAQGSLSVESFTNAIKQSYTANISKPTKSFFKWLLNI
jgi:hypothetical protein